MPSDQSILSKVHANQKASQTKLRVATDEYVSVLISNLNSKLRSAWKSKYDEWCAQNDSDIKAVRSKAKTKNQSNSASAKQKLDASYPKLYQIIPPGLSDTAKLGPLRGVPERIYTSDLFTFGDLRIGSGDIPPAFWNANVVELGTPDEKYSSLLKSDEIKQFSKSPRKTLSDVKEQYESARAEVQSFAKYSKSSASQRSETTDTYEASVHIDALQSLEKYSWRDPRLAQNPDAYADYIDFITHNPYNPARASSGSQGSGPGETWLARLFGGSVQGMKQSFDLILPLESGQIARYEVKAIEKDSKSIRAGAVHGLRAYHTVREKLAGIFDSMRTFCAIVEKNEKSFKSLSTIRLHSLYETVKTFYEDKHENMVMNGNITIDTIKQLRAILNQILSVKSQMSVGDAAVEISYGGRKVTVSPQKLRRIIVLLAEDDDDVPFEYDPVQLAFATIGSSDAFSNPDEFIKQMFDSVNIRTVFPGVDGIVVSSQDGFVIVKANDYDTAFVLGGFKEGRPTYNFVLLSCEQFPIRHWVNTRWRSCFK